MPTPLAARRLEVHAAARADLAGFVRLDPARLRFSLGTSLADVSVPIEVSADAAGIVRGAAVELGLLLTSHHRSHVAGEDIDRLILRDDYANLPPVPPLIAPSGGGPDLRTAAQLGPAIHPALTGGLVSAWMGRGGRGRSLVALWIELLRQGFAEMEAARGRERTPLLVALALSAVSGALEAELRPVLPAAPVDRYFRAGALAGLWLAARTGLARAWRESGRPASDVLLLQLEAVLNPPAFLGGRAGILQGGITLYGLELSAGVPRADDLLQQLQTGGSAEAVAAAVATCLAEETDLGRRAEQAVAVARLREILSDGLALAEAGGPSTSLDAVRDLLTGPGSLAAATADAAARKVLLRRIQAGAGRGSAGPLKRAAEVVESWRQKDPGASLGVPRELAQAEYGSAVAALLADVVLERIAAEARRACSFRTGREAEGGADAEWEGGRLYRLSARSGPILREREERRTGHLFADVKDFTRRTALLGEASMAEFLRREFYGPILTGAKEHFGGMSHLADRGGVALNNLLGDAISFSGPIEVMVFLAKIVRSQLAAYGMRLAREVSREVVAKQIAAIEQAQAAALATARAAREGAEAQLLAGPQGTPRHSALQAQLQRTRYEEARLSAERDRALSRARGEALEAGTFISYGPEPLVLVIEDDVFGRNRVAIAEKINESARGTARAFSARARADGALQRERARRKNPALPHAWSVFIGQPLDLQLPPEAEDAAVRAWRAGDQALAMRLLSGPARAALQAAARPEDQAGDIYNGGAALSEEALECFLSEVQRSREVRRFTLEPRMIPEELKARWFFGEEPQELVVCGQGSRILELFRRVGRASFKGLGGVAVWELCAEDAGPGALVAALGASWLRG
ncbi:MAG TPA: hypothetical protein VFG59_06320 [Anaeromyxobacter sp.]|nr:hypothetical protein [Anaeromyxobacter sp.]